MLETMCEWKKMVTEDWKVYKKEQEGFKKRCDKCDGYDTKCEFYTTFGKKPKEIK